MPDFSQITPFEYWKSFKKIRLLLDFIKFDIFYSNEPLIFRTEVS